MKELILASNNAHKVEEIKSILSDYNILTLKDIILLMRLLKMD